MNKIYGFKENRIKDFGEYLKRTENTKSLTKIFSDYSATSGMSKGTVRNMYYALARACKKDRDLKKTYWGEKEIKVNKSEFFSPEKERELVKKVMFGKMNGKSIRKSVYELADGNEKLALRYQNKFRNVAKEKPSLIDEVSEEIEKETGDKYDYRKTVGEFAYKKLEREIDALVDRISADVKKENEELKLKVAALTEENLKLYNALSKSSLIITPTDYFGGNGPLAVN
ncbi:MAG: hypothetical protein SPJ19_06580 [Candidatus Borkfalkiaceae bacterium]|nr:hypothetical protein [Christensenellaceae bacterium]